MGRGEDVEGGFSVGGFEGVGGLGGGCCCLRVLEWKGLLEGRCMCIPSSAEAAFTRGMSRGLASRLIWQGSAIRPSEQVDRMNIVRLIKTKGKICVRRWISS